MTNTHAPTQGTHSAALPTQRQVDEAVANMLHALGYFAPVGPTASDESDDRARRDQLAQLVANALPGRIHRAMYADVLPQAQL